MKQTLNIICIVVISSVMSATTFANSKKGVLLEVNFFPTLSAKNNTNNIVDGTSPSNEYKVVNSTGVDTRNSFSYIFGSGLLLGLTYNSFSRAESRAASSSDDKSEITDQISAYGPSVGYAGGNWRFIYTHFISGERKHQDKQTSSAGATTFDTTNEFSDLTGYQLLIGYSFPISSWFELGTALVHQNMVFKKQAHTNALDANDSYPEKTMPSGQQLKMSSWDPMISLLFRF